MDKVMPLLDIYSTSPYRTATTKVVRHKSILRNNDNLVNTQPPPEAPAEPPKTIRELQEHVANQFLKNSTSRARSASVNSQKSLGAGDDGRNPIITLRNPRQTTVAFGRTTNVADTIKVPHLPPSSYRPPVGTIKDVMDLRRTVEHQSVVIQAQSEELRQLKDDIQLQTEKYCYLLESNAKLWAAMNNLESCQTNAVAEKKKYGMDREEVVKESASLVVSRRQPLDSVVACKKNKEDEGKRIQNVKNDVMEERQVSRILPAKKEPSYSEIQRAIKDHPDYARRLAKERHADEDAKKTHGEHRRDRHQHHQSSVVEKITVERKIINKVPKYVEEVLESTIDDTLDRLGVNDSRRDRNRRHHHAPSTPSIREVSSSSSSSSESDAFAEDSQIYSSVQNGNGEKNKENSGFTRQPDHFRDTSSDSDSMPPPEIQPRHRVADRLQHRRR